MTVSLRGAINAKCKDCIYDPLSGGGTWREQVAQYSAPACPLWIVRPSPGSGPFANPPRNPATVTLEWITKPVGQAFSAHPLDKVTDPVCS
jgi:hypothetical protein